MAYSAPSSAAPSYAKQPPLMVLRAKTAYTARSALEATVHPGDFFHVLQQPAHPAWLPICNPITGFQGLAPAHAFEVLSRTANGQYTTSRGHSASIGQPVTPARGRRSSSTSRTGGSQREPRLPSSSNRPPGGLRIQTSLGGDSGKGAHSHPPPASSKGWAGRSRSHHTPASQTSLPPSPSEHYLVGQAVWDFVPAGTEQLGLRCGTGVRVCAHIKGDWLLVVRLDGRAGELESGLVPASCITLLDPRTGQQAGSKVSELLAAGAIPSVEEWNNHHGSVVSRSQCSRAGSRAGSAASSPASEAPSTFSAASIDIPRAKSNTKGTPWQMHFSPVDLSQPQPVQPYPARTRSASQSDATSVANQTIASKKVPTRSESISGLVTSTSTLSNCALSMSPGSVIPYPATPATAPLRTGSSQHRGQSSVAMPPSTANVQSHKPKLASFPRATSAALQIDASLGPPSLQVEPSPVLQQSVASVVNCLDNPDPGAVKTGPSELVHANAQSLPTSSPAQSTQPDFTGASLDVSECWPLPKGMPLGAQVAGVYKEDDEYWYYVQALWLPANRQATIELMLYRLYSDFAKFHTAMQESYPANGLPDLPPPISPSDPALHTLQLTLDFYTRALVGLPQSWLSSETVRSFFNPQPGDRVVHRPANTPRALQEGQGIDQAQDRAAQGRQCFDNGIDSTAAALPAPKRCSSPTEILVDELARMSTDVPENMTSRSASTDTDRSLAQNPYTSHATTALTSGGRGLTKVKVFHSATDELVSIRVDPFTVTHEQLLAKVRERLGGDIRVLRYPEALGAIDAAVAMAAAITEEPGAEMPPTLGKIFMARLSDDEDVHDWLDQSPSQPTLFAATQ